MEIKSILDNDLYKFAKNLKKVLTLNIKYRIDRYLIKEPIKITLNILYK